MSKVVRSVKNVTKGYSNAQIKVRNATSNDAWGPVGADMAEIAQLTFNDTATFYEIMDILDKRLNDKGKNWRHVLKSLKVLDYCLHEGSELVVTWARKNIYIIKTLREFQHIDDDGRDVGQNIRVSAKELTSLILDEERLRAERKDRKSWKSRVHGIDDFDPDIGPSAPKTPKKTERRNKVADDDDLEMRLAIEASKNEAEEDAKRRAAKGGVVVEDDDDLAKAIKLSKEEEELRRRELEDSNANLLFDDTPSQPAVSQPTGWNQGYQQQPTVDWFGNVIDAQAPQQTGYLAQGGYPNGFGGMNPQMTGYMTQPLQQQHTSFHMSNPYAQQQNGFGAFGQQQQQQPQQPEPAPAPGSNNPWGGNTNNHLVPADTQVPMPTGSNNPFANKLAQPAQNHSQMKPTLNTLQEQKATTSFNPIMNFQAPVQQPIQEPSTRLSPQPSPFQQQQQSNQPVDPMRARLNELLASGEGLDTFGNVGDLRIPSQHTAPGTFVNSAGAGLNKLTNNATGNPFLNSQFTGMPQQQRIQPAQTGPVPGYGAGGYGASSTNPFGGAGANRQQGGQASGNLIDL